MWLLQSSHLIETLVQCFSNSAYWSFFFFATRLEPSDLSWLAPNISASLEKRYLVRFYFKSSQTCRNSLLSNHSLLALWVSLKLFQMSRCKPSKKKKLQMEPVWEPLLYLRDAETLFIWVFLNLSLIKKKRRKEKKFVNKLKNNFTI